MDLALKMTSVEKDLKIKFTNQKTGKLVGNQAFTVSIAGPHQRRFQGMTIRTGSSIWQMLRRGITRVTVTGRRRWTAAGSRRFGQCDGKG